ncbi:MAG: DNA primase [Chloroflexota bacterium]
MPDSTIDEIKRRLDVVDVIGQTVQLKRAGKGFKGLCPFHGEKSPSFWVTPERGTWHCFGCGEGGDIFSFVQKRDNLDFREALKFLGERAGVAVQEAARPDPNAKQERDRHHAILESMALYYRGALAGPAGAEARAYIDSRGLTAQTSERFALGYADAPGRGLERHLTRAGYGLDECVKAGALGRSEDGQRVFDRFRDRVIFPIRDVDGHVIGFGGRAMRADQQPKYLNSPQTDVFDKGSNLYALDQARDTIRKQGQAIVVEGYMDALMAHQAGFTNVIATLGTAITERHVQTLRRQSAREIVLCLDNDAAGLRAALRGSGVAHDSTRDEAPRIDFSLLNQSERMRGRDNTPAIFIERRTILKAFSLTDGKDPDEVIRHDPDQWVRASAGAKPIIDFVFENLPRVYDLSVTEGRREAARAAVGLIYDVSDPIDRDQYLQRLATVIGTGVDILREFARRSMHVVARNEAAPARPVSPLGQPPAPASPDAPPAPPDLRIPLVDPDEQLQDFVIALLLRVGTADVWPEANDFASALHRAILQHLQDGPAWPDVTTALDRLEGAFGETAADTLQRVRTRDELNEHVSPEEIRRELDVRRLELRKHRLFRQHQALVSALREEGEGLNAAERHEAHQRLAHVAARIGETIAEQQRLGVVGTASWNIRRGQEVLGG